MVKKERFTGDLVVLEPEPWLVWRMEQKEVVRTWVYEVHSIYCQPPASDDDE